MSSKITIKADALAKNLNFLRKIIGRNVKLSAVVKGNAYGHGIDVFVPLAESLGINHFSVFSSDEAREVLRVFQSPFSEIMIMGHIHDQDLEWVIQSSISFFVFDFHRLEHAITIAQKIRKTALIHIEIETGMHRTGFDQKEIPALISLLRAHRQNLELAGICTHFAGAESISNFVRVQQQKEVYMTAVKEFANYNLIPKYRHASCSAAAIRFPDMHLDMVRIGILLYGFWPSREVSIEFLKNKETHDDPLHRLISWQSTIMNIKSVAMGEYIGYGTSYLAQRNMTVALVPIGYAQGFSRGLSNTGRVLVRGIRVPVIGTVNMNGFMIDITNVPGVKIDDCVTIIGKDGDLEISVAGFTELSEQVNYELLTRLPINIPRNIT